MDRKYGQRGYQDSDRAREREPEREKPREKPKGGPRGSKSKEPRTMHMPGFQDVVRCALCGAIVPPPVEISFESQCPKCKADLRSCKNCRHFDTGARFECTQPISERITKKDVRNRCEFFMTRTSIERETRDSGGSSNKSPAVKPSDARSAFDNLFKK
jgi:hypothetical protein